MKSSMFYKKETKPNDKEWKEKNKRYLKQLQKFLDVVDNIEKEDLRKSVIFEMLKCDSILTDLAQKEIRNITESLKNE